MCQSLFFNEVEGLRPVTLLKRDSGTGLSCEFYEIFKGTHFAEHLQATASENYDYDLS